jgi:hypothetical protein
LSSSSSSSAAVVVVVAAAAGILLHIETMICAEMSDAREHGSSIFWDITPCSRLNTDLRCDEERRNTYTILVV